MGRERTYWKLNENTLIGLKLSEGLSISGFTKFEKTHGRQAVQEREARQKEVKWLTLTPTMCIYMF